MPAIQLLCDECGAEFTAPARSQSPVVCPDCGAEIKPARQSRGRKRAATRKKKSPNVALAAVVGLVVIGGIAAFALAPKSAPEPKPIIEKPEEGPAAPSIFDSSTVGETPTSNGGGPERATGGKEPRTVDMDRLTKHFGHMYLSAESEAEIRKLLERVEEYRRERYHVSSEMTAEYRRLIEKVSAEEFEPFLSRADSELFRHNVSLEKSDLLKRDKDNKPLEHVFSGFAMKPYVFFVQNDAAGGEAEIAARIHDQLTQLQTAFVDYFGRFVALKGNPRHQIIYVMLLRTFADYQNYNRIRAPFRDEQMSLAHYEPVSRTLVVPLAYGNRRGPQTPEEAEHELREVMFHEGTHQLLHYFASKEDGGNHLSAYGSMWSDEGVAEFFGGHSVGPDGRFKFGLVNSRIESVAADQNDPKRRLSMEDLLKWSRSEYERKKAEQFGEATNNHLHVYSQGWALVHFLNYHDNGKYKAKFEDIMRRQIETGDTGLPVFRIVFGDDFDRVAAEFNAYLDAMSNAYKDKKAVAGSSFPN